MITLKTATSGRSSRYDVVVCGGGILGCYTALMLESIGARTLIVERENTLCASKLLGHAVFWPSPNDPATRAVVAHGIEVARYLNEFVANGLQVLKEKIFPRLQGFAFEDIPCSRLAKQTLEIRELRQAVELDLGLSEIGNGWFEETTGACVGSGFAPALRDALAKSSKVDIRVQSTVVKIVEDKEGCTLILSSGENITCEMIVAAMNAGNVLVDSRFNDILVPMLDVQSIFFLENTTLISKKLFRSSNGHFTLHAHQTNNNTGITLTGPRFLLPSAGIGVTQVAATAREALEKKILNFFSSSIAGEMFRDASNAQPLKPQFVYEVDCHPCDELPVLGEYGKHGRILGCAGWLGVGLTAHAQAAKILVDLISDGRSSSLLPLLRPTRFQTL